jgi:hypothetical protein
MDIIKGFLLALAIGQTRSDCFLPFKVDYKYFFGFRIRIRHQILKRMNTLMAIIIFICIK